MHRKRNAAKYLEENVAAETLQLDPAQMKVLDDALAPGKVSGKRYADWIMATRCVGLCPGRQQVGRRAESVRPRRRRLPMLLSRSKSP